MGSCISKFRQKPPPPTSPNLVQDKLVISQVPSLSIDLPKKPSHSSSCSCSFSSSSTAASTPTTSTSTITTANSSLSKDKAFSDEFLWSCIKENLHILPVDPVKLSPVKPVLIKPPAPKPGPVKKPITTTPRQLIPSNTRSKQSENSRSNSPPLGRQKSFRRDPSPVSLPKRNLSSPSPSRRFTGDGNAGLSKNLSKQRSSRREGADGDNGFPRPVATRKENLRSLRPCEVRRQHGSCIQKREIRVQEEDMGSCINKRENIVQEEDMVSCRRKRETLVQEIPPEEDSKVSKDSASHRDFNCPPLEDLNNPLISLDCFIFL